VNRWLKFHHRGQNDEFCTLCRAPTLSRNGLCSGCRGDLPRQGTVCRVCAVALTQPGLCGQCLTTLPPYSRILAPFRYDPPVDYLIRALKYHAQLHYARVLGLLLAGYIVRTAKTDSIDCAVPVPLHISRLRQRGFNQAMELARPLCRRLGLPLMPNLCRRVRASDSQSQLPAGKRAANVSGVFEAGFPLSGEHVAIIDDVLTTGSTAGEMARSLLSAGAGSVEVWVVARASLDA